MSMRQYNVFEEIFSREWIFMIPDFWEASIYSMLHHDTEKTKDISKDKKEKTSYCWQ